MSMLDFSDGKPWSDSDVQVYVCRKCSYVARLDNKAMIPNRCPQCRKPNMHFVRDQSAEKIAAYLGVPMSQWEDVTK